MEREHRYIVIKIKDAQQALSEHGFNHLRQLAGFVADWRSRQGKIPLACVVVESDWPEYEPTWAAIAARMDGVAVAEPQQAAAHKAEVYEQMAARIAALEKDAEEAFATGQRMAQLLTGVANALRGEPAPLSAHSWHDLPERAAAAIAAINVMQKAAAALAQQQGKGEEFMRPTRVQSDNLLLVAGAGLSAFVPDRSPDDDDQGERQEDLNSSDPTIRQVYPQYGMGSNQVRITNTKVNPDGSLSVEIYFQAKRED